MEKFEIGRVYWGTKAGMVTECALPTYYDGRYVVIAEKIDGTWYTPDCFDTKRDAKESIKELRRWAVDPTFPACFVG